MTQRQIGHQGGLPKCAAGHSARHIHDLRGLAAGGGHLVKCRCRATSKHAEPEAALAEWRRINRAARAPKKALPAIEPPAAGNVVQLGFGLVPSAPPRQRTAGGGHGRR